MMTILNDQIMLQWDTSTKKWEVVHRLCGLLCVNCSCSSTGMYQGILSAYLNKQTLDW